MSKIKPNILELAAKLEPLIEINSETGIAPAVDNAFIDNLPESLTEQNVKDLNDYRCDFTAAATYAFGNMAIKALSDNKQLESVSGSFNTGVKDRFEVVTHRETVNRIPDSKDTVTKHGATRTTYVAYAGRNVGQLKVVRDQISEMAAESLK